MFFNVGHVMLLFATIALGKGGGRAAAAPPACTAASQAEADVRTVVGGMFAVDHLGPAAHGAVVARVRAEPSCHLAVVVRIARGLDAARLSHTYPSALLELVANAAPEDGRQAARTLITLHQRALAVPPSDEYQRFRLERAMRTLAQFLQ